MQGQMWVEVVGDMIIARVRGEPTADLLRECQDKVLFLVRDAGRGKVLYDTLEMEAPPVDVRSHSGNSTSNWVTSNCAEPSSFRIAN